MTYTAAAKIGPALVTWALSAGFCSMPASKPITDVRKYKQAIIGNRYRKAKRRGTYCLGHKIKKGEKPLKEWAMEMAVREGLTMMGIYRRMFRGAYPDHKFRRINKRVVFVTPPSV